MRKSLLKTFFVAFCMVMGTSSAFAVDYVTTTVNAADETKQDVTYTFNGSSSASDGVLVGGDPVATVFNGTDNTNLYASTTEGLERLAFNAAAGTGMRAGQWWWRSGGNYGIQLRASNAGGQKGGIAILNLKAGNTVKITGASIGTNYYSFPGATTVNGEAPSVSGKGEGEATYTAVISEDGKQIDIEVTADGYVAAYVSAYNYGYIQSIVITEEKAAASAPTGAITKVDGTSRVISLETVTAGADIYYTTDGTTPSAASTLYDATTGIVITGTTTINAVTVADGVTSEVYTETFEAGTEIVLNAPSYSITGMTAIVEGKYYPSYSFSTDNSDILLAPQATLTATVNGEAIENFEGTYAFEVDGTIVVTASAEGYASSSITIEAVEYGVSKTSINFDEIGESNITEILGESWSIGEGSTRWASWSRTGGKNTDLTANEGDAYYVASGDAVAIDFVQLGDNINLLVGYGFGSNNGIRTISVIEPAENSIAEYGTYVTNNESKSFVDYNTSNTLTLSIPRSSTTVKNVVYYVPNDGSVTGIKEVKTANQAGDNAYYSISGVRVAAPAKGLYIKNGKKVIVK